MEFLPALDFSSADLRLQSPEAVARQMRVAPGFVRICIDAGVPTRNGMLSAAHLFEWLMNDGFRPVRRIAGLDPIPALKDASDSKKIEFGKAAAALTVLDFTATRSVDPASRLPLQEACEILRVILENLRK